MDPEFHNTWCQETNRKLVLVKLPTGDFKTFRFDSPEMAFHQMSCSDCFPPQMDSDLTPRHTEWCPHLRHPIVFAYNHVVKLELQYVYNVEMGRFEEVRCSECHLNVEKTTDAKQIVLVAASPSTSKPSVLSVTESGRLVKKRYDEASKVYTDMEPTMIKALTMGPVEKEKEPIQTTKHLVEGSPIVMESDLLPQYRLTSQHLPAETILFAKNKQTGKLGAYLFDRFTHQFLAVNLPDIDIQTPAPEGRLAHACIAHIILPSGDGLSLYHSSEETGIQKYIYRKTEMSYRLLENAPVVWKASAIRNTLKEVMKQEQSEDTRKMVKFLKTVRRFMVDQDVIDLSKNPKTSLKDSISAYLKAADEREGGTGPSTEDIPFEDIEALKKECKEYETILVRRFKRDLNKAVKEMGGVGEITIAVELPKKTSEPPSAEAEEVVKKMLKGLKDKFQEKQRTLAEAEGQGTSTYTSDASSNPPAAVTPSSPSDKAMSSDTQSVSTDSFEMVSDEELKGARED